MSIELTLWRTVDVLLQKRIAKLEHSVSYPSLSPALLKDIGLEGEDVLVEHVHDQEFKTSFLPGNRIT